MFGFVCFDVWLRWAVWVACGLTLVAVALLGICVVGLIYGLWLVRVCGVGFVRCYICILKISGVSVR